MILTMIGINMTKYIIVKNCSQCKNVSIKRDIPALYCYLVDSYVDEYTLKNKVHPNCPLDDYPVTVNEFLGGKI